MRNVVFYVMTSKGLEALREACEVGSAHIDYVVVASDSNVENDFSEDIRTLARQYNIKFYERGLEPALDPEIYVLAVSWRWMINHPESKLIIFHDSLLPKYRGFAPLVNMLINGESKIGVTAIFGAAEYDRGEVLGQSSVNIEYPIKISEAIDLNLDNFRCLVRDIISRIVAGTELIGVPQEAAEATYSIWRDKEDYRIDWTKSAQEIKRFVDALGYPYIGAFCFAGDDCVRILEVEIVDDVYCELRHIGKVLFVDNGEPTVICGRGLVRITEAKLCGEGDVSYLPLKKFRTRFS